MKIFYKHLFCIILFGFIFYMPFAIVQYIAIFLGVLFLPYFIYYGLFLVAILDTGFGTHLGYFYSTTYILALVARAVVLPYIRS